MGETMKIVFSGRPATKKNSGRIVMRGKFPKLLPSKAFVVYEENCLSQLRTMRGLRKMNGWIHVQVDYWLPDRAHWPDLTGLTQATGDILQKAGLIEDDKYIALWDGSRIAGLDKSNPRAEITIRVLPEWESELFGQCSLAL